MKKTHVISAYLMKATVCLFFATTLSLSVMSAANEKIAVSATVSAQQSKVTVKGVVKDTDGNPVIGASVFERGVTSNGTVTDYDGKFSITVERGATLIVSSIGFVTEEVAAENASSIILMEDAEMLQDVVVIGYGTQRKVMSPQRLQA